MESRRNTALIQILDWFGIQMVKVVLSWGIVTSCTCFYLLLDICYLNWQFFELKIGQKSHFVATRFP